MPNKSPLQCLQRAFLCRASNPQSLLTSDDSCWLKKIFVIEVIFIELQKP